MSDSKYASHVVLRATEDGTHTLSIDGNDVSNAVLTEGFSLHFDDNDGKMLPELHLTVTFAVDEVDADIKAAVHAVIEKQKPRRKRSA